MSEGFQAFLLISWILWCFAAMTWRPYFWPMKVRQILHFIFGGPFWWVLCLIVWIVSEYQAKEVEKQRKQSVYESILDQRPEWKDHE